MSRFRFLLPALFLALSAGSGRPSISPHLLVTTSDGTTGNTASLELSPPWSPSIGLEAIGPVAVARTGLGLHWIVNGSPVDEIQTVDPETWETVRRVPLGDGADPHDIVLVSEAKAYVSLHGRPYVLVMDPGTGATVDSLDLSAFADPDGIPDMSRLEKVGDLVFVQLQRLDHSGGWGEPVAPSMLAVIDAVQDTLVDSDPAVEGTQAIVLTGLYPVNDMQAEGDRLFVVEQGSLEMIDPDGGIDVIDVPELRSLGFLTTEGLLGGHTDCFVLVSPTKGYAVTHTDLLLSSHLTPFSRDDGSPGGEVFAIVESRTDQLAYDPVTDYLYFPDGTTGSPGIRVFDARTDAMLTPSAIATGLPPRDVLVVRPPDPTGSGVPPAAEVAFVAPRPNPFRLSVEIPFTLTRSAPVAVEILDVAGRRRFAGRKNMLDAGAHLFAWDGRDLRGKPVPPGVYFVRLSTPAGTVIRSVVRLPRD